MTRRFRQGFSLVELVLALMMGGVVVAGLSLIYVTVARQTDSEHGRLDQDLRARDLLQPLIRDLRHLALDSSAEAPPFVLRPPTEATGFPVMECAVLDGSLPPPWPGRPQWVRAVWTIEASNGVPGLVRTVVRASSEPGDPLSHDLVARPVRSWSVEAQGLNGWTSTWPEEETGLPRAVRMHFTTNPGEPPLEIHTLIPAGAMGAVPLARPPSS